MGPKNEHPHPMDHVHSGGREGSQQNPYQGTFDSQGDPSRIPGMWSPYPHGDGKFHPGPQIPSSNSTSSRFSSSGSNISGSNDSHREGFDNGGGRGFDGGREHGYDGGRGKNGGGKNHDSRGHGYDEDREHDFDGVFGHNEGKGQDYDKGYRNGGSSRGHNSYSGGRGDGQHPRDEGDYNNRGRTDEYHNHQDSYHGGRGGEKDHHHNDGFSSRGGGGGGGGYPSRKDQPYDHKSGTSDPEESAAAGKDGPNKNSHHHGHKDGSQYGSEHGESRREDGHYEDWGRNDRDDRWNHESAPNRDGEEYPPNSSSIIQSLGMKRLTMKGDGAD